MGCHFYDYITNCDFFHLTSKEEKLLSLLACFNKAIFNIRKAHVTRSLELPMAIILSGSENYKQV